MLRTISGARKDFVAANKAVEIPKGRDILRGQDQISPHVPAYNTPGPTAKDTIS